MADDGGFVRRWSRRKREARAPVPAIEPAPPLAATPAETSPAATPTAAEVHPEPIPEPGEPAALPAIESLTYQSDFTVFLRPGVPAELRKRALQQLWRCDPVLANLDGLVEYGEDYSRIGIADEVVRTAYRVGRGMLDRLEAAAAEPPADQAPAGETAAAGPASIEQSAGGTLEGPVTPERRPAPHRNRVAERSDPEKQSSRFMKKPG